MDPKGHGGSVGTLLRGTQAGLAGAGICVATVEQNGAGLAAFKMTAGEQDGCSLHQIRGEDPGGRGSCLGNDKAEIVTLLAVPGWRALDTAGDGGSRETLGGINATGNTFD